MKIAFDTKIVRYLFAGGTAFVVEYATFFVLLHSVHTSVVVATSVSFGAGLITSFLCNRRWTFSGNAYTKNAHHQFAYYIGLALANLFIVNNLVLLFQHVGISPSIGKLITMCMLPVWNYFIFQKFIFTVHK